MKRARPFVEVASLAIGAALALPLVASPADAKDRAVLRLRAFAVDLNTRARTGTLDIVIERWSTPEEVAKLKAAFLEAGGDALLSALQKTRPRCGYTATPSSIGWDVYFARETPLPGGGRKIVVASDRPVSFWEARDAGRSLNYQFSLAEIRLGPDGKGEGKTIPYAQLSFDKATNTLEIENYQREPVRLTQVEVLEPEP